MAPMAGSGRPMGSARGSPRARRAAPPAGARVGSTAAGRIAHTPGWSGSVIGGACRISRSTWLLWATAYSAASKATVGDAPGDDAIDVEGDAEVLEVGDELRNGVGAGAG